jgi:hypothetical protein
MGLWGVELVGAEVGHSQQSFHSRQRSLLAKPFKETFLPFWLGSGVVRVEVMGAEVGHEHLVTR